jgi:tetratricopeptide (TPR) repeat protein
MRKKYMDVILIAISLLVIFQIYLYTTYPAFKSDDSPETITAAYTLGISHPPGYPLFTMMAKIFTYLPIGAPAFRVNVFSCFLAILVLLITYYLIKSSLRKIFNINVGVLNYMGVFILAFSYIFWNQAIEAKGGIYILNLLFFSSLIYISSQLMNNFKTNNLYLMSYIYGLSLTNHSPSMAIMLPVFGYFFYKYRSRINAKNTYILIVLFFIGISPYIFLPLRAGAENVFVFMNKPDNWQAFLETVLRTGYANPITPSLDVYKEQAFELLKLFMNNFSFLWIIIFLGFLALWKKNKELFVFYAAAVIINDIVVVLFNPTQKELLWVVDIFSMPAQFILLILIITGSYYITDMLKTKIYKNIFICFIAILVLYLGYSNFKINDSRENFLSYDFGNNIVKTIEPGSFYFVKSDYFVMPVLYLDRVNHKMNGTIVQPLFTLLFKFEDFEKKYGFTGFNGVDFNSTVINLFSLIAKTKNVYISGFTNNPDEKIGDFAQRADGLISKLEKVDKHFTDNVFGLYSYRNIYDKLSIHDKNLIIYYSVKMGELANEYVKANMPYNAIDTYKKALLLPAGNNEGDLYFNLAIAYKGVSDTANEIESLKKVILKQNNFWPAYEELGKLYVNTGDLFNARIMFQNALRIYSPNRQILEQYISAINQRIGNIQ